MSENPFNGEQLQGREYARADMTDVHFNGVQMSGARFWAVLENAVFKDTNLAAASFDDVNLSGASFQNINLTGTTIRDANLSGMTIQSVTMENASISDANLDGMRIDGVLVTDLFAAYRAKHSD